MTTVPATQAYQRICDALTAHGSTLTERSAGHTIAQCPAHQDGRPSLSVSIGKTGDRAVLHCFAGCTDTAVLGALGMVVADLFDQTATYTYAGGAVVHRGAGKRFRQTGNKTDRSLYRAEHLPDDLTVPVLVVEGEKDANTAAYLDGVFAVSPRQGASTGPERYDWSPLKDRPVLVVADNEQAGRQHARRVADLLARVAASVTTVIAAEGKDFTDHVQNGHTVAELVPVNLDELAPRSATPAPDELDGDIWNSRPILAHIRDFARHRRVGPVPLLGALLLRAIAATDPRIVLPPIIGDVASLNLCVAFVGPSGHGKGATESAARAATNLPLTDEFPVGSGEGLARTFAPNAAGVQEVRRAIFTASEVDGLAAMSSRQGSTIMAVIRQLYSGEAIGAANAQKHTRVIVPRHSYRACLSIGVQPERAAPILDDLAGTAQRMLWLPVGDPDAPDVRPAYPGPREIIREFGPPGDGPIILDLPVEAIRAVDAHNLAKLRGEDVDPLDGHKLLTREKVAAGFMLLDGRLGEITLEDWELAGRLIAVSDACRDRIARQAADAARRANRGRALAQAEREEMIAERKLDRAKAAVLRWLESGEQSAAVLRRRAPGRWRDDVAAALAELIDEGAVSESEAKQGGRSYRLSLSTRPPVHPSESAQVRGSFTGGQDLSTGGQWDPRTGGQVDRRVDTHNRRSDTGGTGGRVDTRTPDGPTHSAAPATPYELPKGSPITPGRHTPIQVGEHKGKHRAIAYFVPTAGGTRQRIERQSAISAAEAVAKVTADLLDYLSTATTEDGAA